jgi:hypothetical protein
MLTAKGKKSKPQRAQRTQRRDEMSLGRARSLLLTTKGTKEGLRLEVYPVDDTRVVP